MSVSSAGRSRKNGRCRTVARSWAARKRANTWACVKPRFGSGWRANTSCPSRPAQRCATSSRNSTASSSAVPPTLILTNRTDDHWLAVLCVHGFMHLCVHECIPQWYKCLNTSKQECKETSKKECKQEYKQARYLHSKIARHLHGKTSRHED